jgi:hypothetical protein
VAYNYLASRATATSLLEYFGQVGSIRRGGTDYPATFAQITAKQEDQQGQIVQRNVEVVLLSATDLAITPKTFDLLVYADGGIRRIDSAVPFAPAGVTVYYELTLEGA